MSPHPVPVMPRTEWIRRFADRAMRVQPSIDSISAVMIADGQFEDAADVEPEEAAEIFAAADRPDRPVVAEEAGRR